MGYIVVSIQLSFSTVSWMTTTNAQQEIHCFDKVINIIFLSHYDLFTYLATVQNVVIILRVKNRDVVFNTIDPIHCNNHDKIPVCNLFGAPTEIHSVGRFSNIIC